MELVTVRGAVKYEAEEDRKHFPSLNPLLTNQAHLCCHKWSLLLICFFAGNTAKASMLLARLFEPKTLRRIIKIELLPAGAVGRWRRGSPAAPWQPVQPP